jgi:RND family efflux transporter MFP subunit
MKEMATGVVRRRSHESRSMPRFLTIRFQTGALALAVLLLSWTGGQRLLAQSPQGSPGITEPFYDGTLSVSVPGTIAKRLVGEGDFVKQGQVIVALDARLEELTVSRRKLVVDTLKTELDGDRKLFETTKSVSKEAVEKKELEYRVAVVDWETAEEQLRKRHIVAPVDGIVTEFFREVGEDCKEQEPVVRVVDTRRCYFVSNVEAKVGYDLKVGQSLKMEIEAGNATLPLEGRVTFVSPVVDPASGLLRVRLVFENPDGRVRPGVPGKLLLEEKKDGR